MSDRHTHPPDNGLPPQHTVRLGLEAQLRQCWAVYGALPSEHNRYQLVRLERMLQEL